MKFKAALIASITAVAFAPISTSHSTERVVRYREVTIPGNEDTAYHDTMVFEHSYRFTPGNFVNAEPADHARANQTFVVYTSDEVDEKMKAMSAGYQAKIDQLNKMVDELSKQQDALRAEVKELEENGAQ
jgi:peptidoglycan hydrolase CwlO-like protein